MSDDTARMYVEDHGVLGPAAYRAQHVGPNAADSTMLLAGLMDVPLEQAERWERAEAAWEQAQAEMRSMLAARRNHVIAGIGDFAGYEAANRAASRPGRRGKR